METKLREKYKIFNRDIIKYIAMVTMLLNHISVIFMEPGHVVSEIFLNIGYFTAITMCYFLVEGYKYTHSKKKYAIRLTIFALVSEIPYCLAFTQEGVLKFHGLNMIFTLLLCFLILLTIEKLSSTILKIFVILGLILLSSISDWALCAPIFTLLFVWADGSKEKIKIAFVISMILFGSFNFLLGIGNYPMSTNIFYALESMAGIAVSGIVIICLYNGKRMEKGKVFSKWFFYWFYPVHLFILGMIRILCL